MEWILIFVIGLYGNSVHSNYIEFKSQKACETARDELKSQLVSDGRFIRSTNVIFCTPKGQKFSN